MEANGGYLSFLMAEEYSIWPMNGEEGVVYIEAAPRAHLNCAQTWRINTECWGTVSFGEWALQVKHDQRVTFCLDFLLAVPLGC